MIKGYIEADDPRYQKWIDKNVPEKCKATCRKKAEAMALAFPELRVVGVQNSWMPHVWCINRKGQIVDPTSHQFNSKFHYPKNFLEVEDFPLGKCHWCGELIWPDTPRAREQICEEEEVGPHTACLKAEEEL